MNINEVDINVTKGRRVLRNVTKKDNSSGGLTDFIFRGSRNKYEKQDSLFLQYRPPPHNRYRLSSR